METLEATFRIVTPLFLGGAEHEADAIRPPSIKGVLRFWWRALNWSECYRESKAGVSAALRRLHKRETHLFGNAADGKKTGGQGCFLMKIARSQLTHAALPEHERPGTAYLLGQGLYKAGRAGGYQRKALSESQDFRLTIIFRDGVTLEDRRQIETALWLMGLIGGLGSRSRRGFGSLSLKAMTGSSLDFQIPTDAETYVASVSRIIGGTDGITEPPFTAFSSTCRMDISAKGVQWKTLLNMIGEQLLTYRSNGRKDDTGTRRVLDNIVMPVDLRFWEDHECAYRISAGVDVKGHPRRVVFGLPHNYYFSSSAVKTTTDIVPTHKDANGRWTSDERGRRASPLFIHIHEFTEDDYGAIQTFMPATFLPANDFIELKGKTTNRIPPSISWQVITDYMDTFTGKAGFRRVI